MLAGRLFQLAVARGKKTNWMNCLVIRGELKSFGLRVSRGSHKEYKLGVQGDQAM